MSNPTTTEADTIPKLQAWIAEARAYAERQRKLAVERPREARFFLTRAAKSDDRATAYAFRLGNLLGPAPLDGTV